MELSLDRLQLVADNKISGKSTDGTTASAPSAPSMTQASLAYIRARMGECRQALQASLESAIEQDLVSADDSAMKHYLLAITSLDESQQAAATAATRLAVAEKALVAFKTAVKLHERSASSPPASVSGAAGGAGGGGATASWIEGRKVQQIKALLQRNQSEAKDAEDACIFWCKTAATHYRQRAELLHGSYAGTGDEHAVVVLLVDDKTQAETAYALESRKSAKLLSGEGYLHRDAIVRLHKLLTSINALEGLDA